MTNPILLDFILVPPEVEDDRKTDTETYHEGDRGRIRDKMIKHDAAQFPPVIGTRNVNMDVHFRRWNSLSKPG